MFTENDYIEYFDEIESLLKSSITIYTDLLNELNDAAIKSKLEPLATESMDFFRFIKEKRRFFDIKDKEERM